MKKWFEKKKQSINQKKNLFLEKYLDDVEGYDVCFSSPSF